MHCRIGWSDSVNQAFKLDRNLGRLRYGFRQRLVRMAKRKERLDKLLVERGLVSTRSRAKGLIMAGLEGSIRYKPQGRFQYTEFEMGLKVLRLVPRLAYNQLFKGRALDILISHSPPLGIHNGQDHVHRGFASFLWLMCP